MLIRKEEPSDYGKVYDLIREAFATGDHSDGNEQDLVEALRKSKNFIPELSLLAVKNNVIIGHILFTKAYVNNDLILALAPLAVAPEFQKMGVGSALIKEGHRIAREMGYKLSVVLGSEKYYPNFGYEPASKYGISPPFDVPENNFMAINLSRGPVEYKGIIQYAKEFF